MVLATTYGTALVGLIGAVIGGVTGLVRTDEDGSRLPDETREPSPSGGLIATVFPDRA